MDGKRRGQVGETPHPHPGGAPPSLGGAEPGAVVPWKGQIFGGAAGGFPAGWRAYRLVGEGAAMKQLFTRNFTLLLLGQASSLLGNYTLRFALSMFVLEETGSAATFAGILAVSNHS